MSRSIGISINALASGDIAMLAFPSRFSPCVSIEIEKGLPQVSGVRVSGNDPKIRQAPSVNIDDTWAKIKYGEDVGRRVTLADGLEDPNKKGLAPNTRWPT